MAKTKAGTQKQWKRPFFRAFWITLILLGGLATVFLGSARAYEAVRQNGFGEKARAFDLAWGNEEEGFSIRVFDFEWQAERPF